MRDTLLSWLPADMTGLRLLDYLAQLFYRIWRIRYHQGSPRQGRVVMLLNRREERVRVGV